MIQEITLKICTKVSAGREMFVLGYWKLKSAIIFYSQRYGGFCHHFVFEIFFAWSKFHQFSGF